MSRIDELVERLCPDGVDFHRLGEIATLVRGHGLPKSEFVPEGVGAIHYGQIYTHFGAWADEVISHVRPDAAARLAVVNPGDVILANTSENLEDVCKALAWVGRGDIVTGGHATVVKHSMEPKFLSYWFQSPSFQTQKRRLATGTKVIDVSARQLEGVKVPVPPLEIQREIVRILDQFTQLEAELEAELEARRAQFMRVREELLHSADGVVTSLGDLADNLDRYRRPIAKAQRASGSIPYYGASGVVDKVDGYIFDDDLLLISEDGANLIARNSPIAFSISGKSWVNNHAHVLRFPNRDVQKFVEFYVNWLDIAQYVSGESQPKLNRSSLDRISIPLPPPCEISRIVSSLGRFEELISGVRASLPAEIAARRKQYEYYRDKLLTFEEKV